MTEKTKLGDEADERLATLNALVKDALLWPKRAIKFLIPTVIVLAIALGITVYVAVRENELAHNLQQDGIVSCQNANTYRAEQTAIWQDLFKLSYENTPPDKNSKTYKLQQEFLQYINKTNAPHDCVTQYGK